MNELVTMTLVAAATLSSAPLQKPESSAALPMAYVEACRLEFTQPASSAKFVGTVEYRATAGRDGVVTRLTFVRHVGNPPPEMRMGRFVQLEHFEACVQRWRFGSAGDYVVALWGGTAAREWRITVSRGDRAFRLVLPSQP